MSENDYQQLVERLTKDVDIIASRDLSLTPQHRLGLGGSSYTLQVSKYAVQVDWIVRKEAIELSKK